MTPLITTMIFKLTLNSGNMANYTPLAQLISDNKNSLCKNIIGLSLPSDAERIKVMCIDFVEGITKKDAEYMKQLSLLEQDLISPVLKVMETLYASDIELSKKISKSYSTRANQVRQSTSNKKKASLAKEYGPALVGAAGGTLLATMCKPSSWGVILMGSVVSAIIGKVLYGLYVDKDINNNNTIYENSASFKEYELTNTDADNVLAALVNAGECIDKVLLTYRKHLEILEGEFKKKEESYSLDKKFLGVLECYQSLIGNLSDMEESPVVTDSVRKINQTLQKQGYKAVNYNADVLGLFNAKKEDVEDVEQFAPAIVKCSGDKEILVLKGDVVIPKSH